MLTNAFRHADSGHFGAWYAMNVLVICRVTDQRLRKKIFARLENWGVRHAKGVFECEFNPAEFAHLREWLGGLAYGGNDCVILYPLCAVCQKNRLAFGNGCLESAADTEWVIV